MAPTAVRYTSACTMSDYLPIAEHGVIGDLHTVALVGTDGTIDWFCCPRFDSPSVFAAILDAERGGLYRIAPVSNGHNTKQLYFPDTNVLITRFLTPDGVGEVHDFMPIHRDPKHPRRLIRRVVAVRGEMQFALECRPRFDYGRQQHELDLQEGGAVFNSPSLSMALVTSRPLERSGADVTSRFTLKHGESATFVLQQAEAGVKLRPAGRGRVGRRVQPHGPLLAWLAVALAVPGPVARDGEPLGADAEAAHVPSVGRHPRRRHDQPARARGGERNWDYRYTWVRDAAFSMYALLRLGFTEEAEAFITWLTDRFGETNYGEGGPLQVMYGIDGRSDLPEEVLGHLEGYMGSAPVRIGNGAATQLQLDIYGELIDSIYLYNKFGEPISYDSWMEVYKIVEWLCENWDKADEGIWETRGGRQNFTYSRVMCWVALERAVRVARYRGLPANLVKWTGERDRITEQIMTRGWNPKRGAFVQHYGSDVLDASLLLMPLTKFIAPKDPRWLRTLDAIGRELVSDSLVYRYNAKASPDGLQGEEGTFSICTFWYVEALARAGKADEARLAFEKMLTYANHLGLYSEEIGPSGEALGNFPQAFTHLSLISAAVNLDRQLG